MVRDCSGSPASKRGNDDAGYMALQREGAEPTPTVPAGEVAPLPLTNTELKPPKTCGSAMKSSAAPGVVAEAAVDQRGRLVAHHLHRQRVARPVVGLRGEPL